MSGPIGKRERDRMIREFLSEANERRVREIDVHFLHIEQLIEETQLSESPSAFIERKLYGLTPALENSPRLGKRPVPPALRLAVFERDDFTCKHCGSQEDLTADHIYPESRGGATTLENLQTLCRSCNSSKGARIPTGESE